RKAGRSELSLGAKSVPLDLARREYERWAPPLSPADWPLYRGAPSRATAEAGGDPLLRARWHRPLTASALVRAWFRDPRAAAATALRVPPGVPVAAAGRLVCRGPAGLCAIDVRSGVEAWRAPSPLSLDAALADPGRKVQLEDWFA